MRIKACYSITMLFFCCCTNGFAQKEGNTWYFGGGYGLDFNASGGPLVLTDGAMSPFEGCASISDGQTGQLLFYTDGINVWSKNHFQMPNGSGLWGHSSSTQSGVIIPWPDNDSLYYIFTVDAQAGADVFGDTGRYGGLACSIVNMSLNGGLGDVTVKNKGLLTPASEKITGVMHCNQKDMWVIAHQWESDAFYAYLVTSSGMDTVPVISRAGSIHTDGGGTSNIATLGYMKASPNGKKIALALYDPLYRVEIVDFDNSTGNVSSPVTDYLSDTLLLPWNQDPYSPYGLSFSPNSRFVYVSAEKKFPALTDSGKIFQYDLLAGKGHPDSIVSSKKAIASVDRNSSFTAMQLGPDNKIYVNQRWDEYLGAIESPDKPGAGLNGCNYNAKAVHKGPGSGANNFGLPTFIESFFGKPQEISLGPDITVCESDIVLDAGKGASYLWSTGSTSQTITVSTSGTYTVQVYSNSNCVAQNGLIDVLVNPFTYVNFTSDSSVCGMPSVLLDAGNGVSYLWSTGETSQTITVTAGTYSVEAYTGTDCVINKKLMNVLAYPFPVVELSADTSVCGIPVVLNAENPNSTYWWSNGSTTSSITVTESGNYTVVVDNGRCKLSERSNVEYITFDEKFSPPNIFTPNRDGQNDLFDLNIAVAVMYDLKIYNRWGNLVYKSQESNDPWDGYQVDEGVYYWILTYAVCPGQTIRTEKGGVTLVK